jgi:Ca-activated chloride channel family protein
MDVSFYQNKSKIMKKFKIRSFIIISGLVLIACSIFAIQVATKATVTGKVLDSQSNLVIKSAKVYLYQDSKIMAQKVTNKEGKFTFFNLNKGTYYFKVAANSYKAYQSKSFVVEEGKTYNKIIKLTADPNSTVEIKKVDSKREEILILDAESCEESIDYAFSPKASNRSRGRKDKAAGGFYANTGYVADQAPIEHNTESYDVINENNFKSVSDDPLSTFSVDVDRAAYANVRRFFKQQSKTSQRCCQN